MSPWNILGTLDSDTDVLYFTFAEEELASYEKHRRENLCWHHRDMSTKQPAPVELGKSVTFGMDPDPKDCPYYKNQRFELD